MYSWSKEKLQMKYSLQGYDKKTFYQNLKDDHYQS